MRTLYCVSSPLCSGCSFAHRTERGRVKMVGGSNAAMLHKNTIQINEVNSQSHFLPPACVRRVICATDTANAICLTSLLSGGRPQTEYV